MKRIARVFPRKTNATPDDELSFIGTGPPLLAMPEIDEAHLSVAFSWDLPMAERLAEEWLSAGVPVKLGGPALNEPGGDFVPGMYLQKGFTITSRGCPNRCAHCAVPAREGFQLRELPIVPGWNIVDDNLLACSDQHIHAVFDMLAAQKRRPEFTGGLEAKLLRGWHVEKLQAVKARRMYFAYDTPDDYEPLVIAGKMLIEAGFKVKNHTMACYVLIGYDGDTFEKAEKRLYDTIRAGFYPYAMLFRDETNTTTLEWRKFQREWLLPKIVGTKIRKMTDIRSPVNVS